MNTVALVLSSQCRVVCVAHFFQLATTFVCSLRLPSGWQHYERIRRFVVAPRPPRLLRERGQKVRFFHVDHITYVRIIEALCESCGVDSFGGSIPLCILLSRATHTSCRSVVWIASCGKRMKMACKRALVFYGIVLLLIWPLTLSFPDLKHLTLAYYYLCKQSQLRPWVWS